MVIILIEPNKDVQLFWETAIKQKVADAVIITAFTGEEARQKFAEHPDVDVIVMSAFMTCHGDRDIAKEIRSSYLGKIIGASNDEDHQGRLLKLGCKEVYLKKDVPAAVLKASGL